jgi:non-canonical poly(A) RNA polymerase PAPD5/7
MLTLRDPADPTNDLGSKAASIKHFQATCKHLLACAQKAELERLRYSNYHLLKDIVGPVYSGPHPPSEWDPLYKKLIDYANREHSRQTRARKRAQVTDASMAPTAGQESGSSASESAGADTAPSAAKQTPELTPSDPPTATPDAKLSA